MMAWLGGNIAKSNLSSSSSGQHSSITLNIGSERTTFAFEKSSCAYVSTSISIGSPLYPPTSSIENANSPLFSSNTLTSCSISVSDNCAHIFHFCFSLICGNVRTGGSGQYPLVPLSRASCASRASSTRAAPPHNALLHVPQAPPQYPSSPVVCPP